MDSHKDLSIPDTDSTRTHIHDCLTVITAVITAIITAQPKLCLKESPTVLKDVHTDAYISTRTVTSIAEHTADIIHAYGAQYF